MRTIHGGVFFVSSTPVHTAHCVQQGDWLARRQFATPSVICLLNPTVALPHLPIATFLCVSLPKTEQKENFSCQFSKFQTLKTTIVIGSRDQALRSKSCLITFFHF